MKCQEKTTDLYDTDVGSAWQAFSIRRGIAPRRSGKIFPAGSCRQRDASRRQPSEVDAAQVGGNLFPRHATRPLVS